MTTEIGNLAPNAGEIQGALVSVDDVRMEYATATGPVQALNGVSLKVEPGRSMAIVGPSGCGKSTLLGILAGLEQPTSGVVQVGPHVISEMSDAERTAVRRQTFGFVFQADNLQPFLTVSENIGLQAVLAGIADDPDIRQGLLEALDVAALGHRFPDQLSGGQRQRVAVARALVHGPSIVLADEPTGSLDTVSSDKVVELLLKLQKHNGTTLVVVTHDRSVAVRMDVVVELRDGLVTSTVGTSTKEKTS